MTFLDFLVPATAATLRSDALALNAGSAVELLTRSHRSVIRDAFVGGCEWIDTRSTPAVATVVGAFFVLVVIVHAIDALRRRGRS